MKVYAVDYPFCIESKTKCGSREYYASINKAKAAAADEFITQEELEDANDEANTNIVPLHSSRLSAKVYEVEVQLKRSVIAAILNGEAPVPATTETIVSEFRYRRGKIVVTNAKAVTEQENVG